VSVRFFSFPQTDQFSPRCGISLLDEGPMKSLRDAENRSRFFRSLGIGYSSVISLSQVHSRVVRVAEGEGDLSDLPPGDGIMTMNRSLVPCVTVADCLPAYLFDPVSGAFGVVHSGWKGTGILGDALALARDAWGSKVEDFRVVLGPHIRSCCYTIDRERADYFTDNFGASCVSEDPDRIASSNAWPYRLSLSEANRNLCFGLGIREENVLDVGDCTACSCDYGSNRRQGADRFAHMAAFISWH
jgi:polyphenol oxidase